MIKRNVLVSVKTNNISKLLLKIYEIGVNIKNVKYLKNKIEFEINIDEYLKLSKYLRSYKFKIKSSVGIFLLFSKIKNNKLFLLSIILFIILIYIFSNTIISVKVVHSKKYIRDIVSKSLEEYGIKKLSWKKDYKHLNEIKNKILEKYPENLEWLEIEQVGMSYVVRVEERIITKIKKEKKSCHLIAKKDALITKLKYTSGQELFNKGDYVKQDDILVSGEIKFNDEIKNNVCASGEVMGEVWYESSVKIPLKYKEKEYTGKKRYNFLMNKTKIFKSRLKNYDTKKKKIFSIFGTDFYILSELEVKYDNKKYSEKEAINKALDLTEEKIKMKLSDKERIISQKVLKNSINDSTMYVEIFSSVEEVISKQVEYKVEEKEVE